MPNTDQKTQKLRDLGVFRTTDAINIGISQPTLSRLASSGVITRLNHGFFIHADSSIDPGDIDFSIACTKFGKKSYVGGLSSLFRHNLIQQVPDQIWVVVPPQSKSDNKLYRCLRTKIDLEIGIEDHKYYRMSSLDRSVVDSLYFATKIGLEIAIGATRSAIKQGYTNEKLIYDMATNLGVVSSFKKYWEAVVSE